jgi:DNA-binding response OmpR family regulator
MANILRAMDAGADEYIMKPFTADVVLEKISSVM